MVRAGTGGVDVGSAPLTPQKQTAVAQLLLKLWRPVNLDCATLRALRLPGERSEIAGFDR